MEKAVFISALLGIGAACMGDLWCVLGIIAVGVWDACTWLSIKKSALASYLTHWAMWKLSLLALAQYCWSAYPASTSVCLYLLTLTVYHSSEHMCTAYFHADKVTWHSFLLDQSWHYAFAMGVSFLELGVRLYFGLYSLWLWSWLFPVGTVCVAVGQLTRIGAEVNAGRNFTHLISYDKQPAHTLVTSGLYRVCRHPGYFGWFLWSVGTQVMLCSPVSLGLFFYASRRFFTERIEEEDYTLRLFFGAKFRQYEQEVSPFPRGFNWMLGKTAKRIE